MEVKFEGFKQDEEKSYTGDIRNWPDGVYMGVSGGAHQHVYKYGKTVLIFDSYIHELYTPCFPKVGRQYRRMVGYSGKIKSIEFAKDE